MLVKAIRLGFYKNRRRRPGDTFPIDSDKEFSNRWMVKVESVEKPQPKNNEPKVEEAQPKKPEGSKPKEPVEAPSQEESKSEEQTAEEEVVNPTNPETEESEEEEAPEEVPAGEEKLSEKELMKLNKEELVKKAEEVGLVVDEALTKAGIVALLLERES